MDFWRAVITAQLSMAFARLASSGFGAVATVVIALILIAVFGILWISVARLTKVVKRMPVPHFLNRRS